MRTDHLITFDCTLTCDVSSHQHRMLFGTLSMYVRTCNNLGALTRPLSVSHSLLIPSVWKCEVLMIFFLSNQYSADFIIKSWNVCQLASTCHNLGALITFSLHLTSFGVTTIRSDHRLMAWIMDKFNQWPLSKYHLQVY